jgi:hypothetical protein
MGDANHIEKGDVPLTAFDLPHMGAIYSGSVCEGFLREPRCLPLSAHSLTQPFLLCFAILFS